MKKHIWLIFSLACIIPILFIDIQTVISNKFLLHLPHAILHLSHTILPVLHLLHAISHLLHVISHHTPPCPNPKILTLTLTFALGINNTNAIDRDKGKSMTTPSAPLQDICAKCGKIGGNNDNVELKECYSCHRVKYCERDCKRMHRPAHTMVCNLQAAKLYEKNLFAKPPESVLNLQIQENAPWSSAHVIWARKNKFQGLLWSNVCACACCMVPFNPSAHLAGRCYKNGIMSKTEYESTLHTSFIYIGIRWNEEWT